MRYDSRLEVPPQPGRSVRRRRWLAPMLGLAMLATVVLAVAQPFADTDDRLPLNFTLFIGTVWLAVGVSPFARGLAIDPERLGYDEFELAALARATRLAYAVLSTLVLLGLAWHCAALGMGWPTARRAVDWLAIGLAAFSLAVNLPAFLAEVIIPFPTDPEEADA